MPARTKSGLSSAKGVRVARNWAGVSALQGPAINKGPLAFQLDLGTKSSCGFISISTQNNAERLRAMQVTAAFASEPALQCWQVGT
jgi:hypothetical protein